jgi:hypothetical protein
MGSLVSSASRSTDTPSSGLRTHGGCLFGPLVRFPDDTTEQSYTCPVTSTMTISRMLVLAAITRRRLMAVIHRLPSEPRHGRPWSCSLARRILIACAALRTNLTIRELAASFAISKSAAHRIVSTMTPRLAALSAEHRLKDRRESWVLDGTLIPTRDQRRAARSKNYRWSCNAQVLIRRRDLRIAGITADSPGNRNDPVHYRGSSIETLCKQHGRVLADGAYRSIPELVTPVFRGNRILRDRAWRRHRRRRARVEHAIARLKNWRVLRDHRRRGCHLADTIRAVAFLHNLHLDELRDTL